MSFGGVAQFGFLGRRRSPCLTPLGGKSAQRGYEILDARTPLNPPKQVWREMRRRVSRMAILEHPFITGIRLSYRRQFAVTVAKDASEIVFAIFAETHINR
jgi:hypothetical protein